MAYNFDGRRYLGGITGSARYLLSPVNRSRALTRAASFAVVHRRFRERMQNLRETFPNARVRGTLHHKAHGLYAFAASGFGDPASLGYAYGAVTAHLGWRRGPCRLPGFHRSPGGRPGRVVLPRPLLSGLHPRGPARHVRETGHRAGTVPGSPTRRGKDRRTSPRG